MYFHCFIDVFLKKLFPPGMVMHTFYPCTGEAEAEAGECLWVWGQPGLQSKFQDRLQSNTNPVLTPLPPQKSK